MADRILRLGSCRPPKSGFIEDCNASRQHGHHRVGMALGSTPPTAGDIKLGWHLMMNEGGRPEQTFLLKGKQPYAAEDAEQIIQTVLKTHTTPVLVHPTYPSPWSRPWKDRAAASPTIYS